MRTFAVVLLAITAAALLIDICSAHDEKKKPDGHLQEVEAMLMEQGHLPAFEEMSRFRRAAQEDSEGGQGKGKGKGKGKGRGGPDGQGGQGGQGGGQGGQE